MARRGWACGVCEAANQPACCAACVNLRLTEKYKLLRRLTQERDSLQRSLDVKLKGERRAARHWKTEHAESALKLLQHLQTAEKLLVQNKLKQEKNRRDLESRMKLLAAASAQLFTIKIELLEHLYPHLIRAQTLNCAASMSELNQKRKHIFRHLSNVFPCCYRQPVLKEKSSDQYLRICGACLPIRDDPHSVSQTALSASLGYMVQLVNQFAHYLSAPILHNAAFAASSSRIWQRASYWDAHPSSRSEEYPLFLPSTPIEVSISIDKHGGARESGYIPLENPRSLIRSQSSRSSGSGQDEDVKQGLKLFKRSISCICAYGYGMFSLPVPSNMSAFEALMELLSLISSQDSKTSRPSLQFNDRPDDSLLESGFSSHSQDIETPRNQGITGMSDLFYIVADSKNKESLRKTESVVDEWDVIDHPTLPPPSQSEDIEHWTRAMIVDATKDITRNEFGVQKDCDDTWSILHFGKFPFRFKDLTT